MIVKAWIIIPDPTHQSKNLSLKSFQIIITTTTTTTVILYRIGVWVMV
jgi:hypothetical protein